jgi:hypothetical protein
MSVGGLTEFLREAGNMATGRLNSLSSSTSTLAFVDIDSDLQRPFLSSLTLPLALLGFIPLPSSRCPILHHS